MHLSASLFGIKCNPDVGNSLERKLNPPTCSKPQMLEAVWQSSRLCSFLEVATCPGHRAMWQRQRSKPCLFFFHTPWEVWKGEQRNQARKGTLLPVHTAHPSFPPVKPKTRDTCYTDAPSPPQPGSAIYHIPGARTEQVDVGHSYL